MFARHRALMRQIAPALGALLLGGVLVAPAAAQSATPAASCAPPPAADVMTAERGAASTATVELAATPASAEISSRTLATVDNFVACWNVDDLGAALALATPRFLQSSFGLADAQAAEAALPELQLGPMELLGTGDVATYADGRASIDIAYQRGPYERVDARWFLAQTGDQLRLDEEILLPPRPDSDHAVLSFSIADDAAIVVLDQSTELTRIDTIVLQGVNYGAKPHVFRVVQVADSPTKNPAAAVAEAEGPIVGLLAVEPGGRESLALAGLPAGEYAIVDPAVEGSSVILTVAEPET
ncbi:MAG: hypothetical protein IT337_16475 [Thermomicrobiales bacterium]|nr:hypothetical protein [Thermomicrobiales bacterium]